MTLKTECEFHGYKILRCGTILSKKGQPMKYTLRARRGGKNDLCVRLQVNGVGKKFTLARLMLEAFDGPMYGYEANHLDRDTMNCHISNLERATPSQNQKHWRADERLKSNEL